MRDMEKIGKKAPWGMVVKYVNLKIWGITIFALADCRIEHVNLKLELIFPDDYPFKGPRIVFVNQIFHPNIDPETREMDMKEYWLPTMDPVHILSLIQIIILCPKLNYILPILNHSALELVNSENSEAYYRLLSDSML